ncbi:MAG: hypothetical protein J0I12_14995 [Candidatus Eremiobacteraeota bacterium]|nr:hypothetical protein [Candidatus Eremiobacteraeota bacterium]
MSPWLCGLAATLLSFHSDFSPTAYAPIMHIQPRLPDRIAARAVQQMQLPPEQHQLLTENLACYVSNYKPGFQEELDGMQGPELLQRMQTGWAQGEHRWVDKIRRDLSKPYSDSQVQQRFEELQGRFSSESQRLVAENQGAFPAKVYVTGSLVKGRFGAHSDLDAIGVSKNGYRPSEHGAVSWQLTDDKGEDFMLKSFMEARQVEPGQSLLEIYSQGLSNKGLQLLPNWEIRRFDYPQRQPEPQPQTGMMWSFADLP